MSKLNSNERVVLGESQPNVVEEHIERYVFSQKWVQGKRVLDLACGTGYGAKLLTQAGADHVTGADLSFDAVEHARNHYKSTEKLHFSVMDGLNLGFLAKSFDVIVSFETIEHVQQPENLLDGFRHALMPGGILLISTPNPSIANFPKGWLRPHGIKPCNPFHYQEYTLREFRVLLERHFRIIYVGGQRPLSSIQLSYLSGCSFAFPRYRKMFHKRFYISLNQSSARVCPIRIDQVPAFFVLVCQLRDQ